MYGRIDGRTHRLPLYSTGHRPLWVCCPKTRQFFSLSPILSLMSLLNSSFAGDWSSRLPSRSLGTAQRCISLCRRHKLARGLQVVPTTSRNDFAQKRNFNIDSCIVFDGFCEVVNCSNLCLSMMKKNRETRFSNYQRKCGTIWKIEIIPNVDLSYFYLTLKIAIYSILYMYVQIVMKRGTGTIKL